MKISKYASIIYRHGQPFYDKEMAPYHIGSGQQFFLIRIAEHPGISQYDLASCGHFDKGTCARAVKKLEEEGYVNRIMDERDKRICNLYVTEAGNSIVHLIRASIEKWHAILTADMSEEEILLAENLMEKLAENAYRYMKKVRKRGNVLWKRQ